MNLVSETISTVIHPSDNTHIPDIDIANANDTSSRADLGDVFGRFLSLLWVATNDACVSSQMDHGASLRTADGAGTTGDEDNPVGCDDDC